MRRALPILLTLALALAAPACGSDDGDEPAATTAPATEPETIPETTEPDRTVERTEFVIAPVLSSGGCPPEVTVPTSAPADGDDGAGDDAGDDAGEGGTTTTAAASEAQGIRSLRGTTDPSDPTDPADDSVPAEVPSSSTDGPVPTADGVFCYTVGESVANGNDLTDATLSETEGGEFQVYARVKPEAIDELNALFNACFAGAPTCPAGEGGFGYAAIIWEGVVLYAPAIQSEDLADGGVSLAGGLTERRARDLITLINR